MRLRFLFVLSVALALTASSCSEPNPVLAVEGGLVQGIETTTPGVLAFKGIPFAAPPVGELRWKAPQPVLPWEGVKVADSFRAPAVQPKHTPGGYTDEFFYDGDPEYSEDCLYLNIWTPAAGKTGAKFPVTLWLHGGGFTAGWSFEPEMDGEEWANHGGILVSCNYRLGIFGFLAHPLLSAENPDGVSGNYGMLDQIAALKWVKANIAQFGGDPDNITVMGQSAGAKSVQNLVTSPLSKGLISHAIIQSGGGLSDTNVSGGLSLEASEASGKELMDWAGLTTLEQMRAASTEEIFSLSDKYFEETGSRIRISTSPVVDGVYLPESFASAAWGGRIADIPYMIGCTLNDSGTNNGNTVRNFCISREENGTPVYSYFFARPLPTDGRPGALQGAFHSSELWYMFKSLRLCWRPFVEADYDLAERMVTAWTNFAAYGDPNGVDGGEWTVYSAESPQSMIFRLNEDCTEDISALGTY